MITFEELSQGRGAQFGPRHADRFIHRHNAARGIIPAKALDGARPQRLTERARPIGILQQFADARSASDSALPRSAYSAELRHEFTGLRRVEGHRRQRAGHVIENLARAFGQGQLRAPGQCRPRADSAPLARKARGP